MCSSVIECLLNMWRFLTKTTTSKQFKEFKHQETPVRPMEKVKSPSYLLKELCICLAHMCVFEHITIDFLSLHDCVEFLSYKVVMAERLVRTKHLDPCMVYSECLVDVGHFITQGSVSPKISHVYIFASPALYPLFN